MNPIRIISCTTNDWKQIVERDLAEGLEVDLVSLNCEYDADYCLELARTNSVEFTMTKKNNYGAFRKRKPTE